MASYNTSGITSYTDTSSIAGISAASGQDYSSGSSGLMSASPSRGRNRDADMYAGSKYAPTKNAGTAKAKQSFAATATSSDDDDNKYTPTAIAAKFEAAGATLPPARNPMDRFRDTMASSLYDSDMFKPYVPDPTEEIETYLGNTAVEDALKEALGIDDTQRQTYQGIPTAEEPEPNIDMSVLQGALQPEPITVEELPDVTVKAGDTLNSIAAENNLPVQDVIDANPQIANPDMIRPGEVVKLSSRFDTKGETPARELPKAKNLSAEVLEGPEALFSGSKQVLSSLTDTLAVGAEGNSVMNAQLRLAELGYDIGRGGKKGLTKNKLGKWSSLDNSELRGVDSDFGPATQRAVMAFQKDAGLPVTGDIDPTTAKALAEKEAVSYRVPAGFTDKYSEKQKTNFKAAEDAAISAGLKGAELAAYMAQVAHESDNFNTAEEYASGAAYEGRKDLGNTQPGDGKKYKGRGYIQLTGRGNYQKAGDALGIDLVNNPELAEEPENAAAISVWFWKSKVRPQVPDFMDTERVTKVVNGGFNGLTDRLKYFDKFTKQWSDAN